MLSSSKKINSPTLNLFVHQSLCGITAFFLLWNIDICPFGDFFYLKKLKSIKILKQSCRFVLPNPAGRMTKWNGSLSITLPTVRVFFYILQLLSNFKCSDDALIDTSHLRMYITASCHSVCCRWWNTCPLCHQIMDGPGENDPDLVNAAHPRFCEAIKTEAAAYASLFTRTFQNKTFHVYRVKKKRKKSAKTSSESSPTQ